ncbi:MAG: hypothetical protein IJQ73_15940 [Kiritimatiellae bacterium]|nr:hypothetical protein [Kiritimatiellia bacterium]
MNSKSFTLSLVASLAATLVIAQDAAAPAAAVEKAQEVVAAVQDVNAAGAAAAAPEVAAAPEAAVEVPDVPEEAPAAAPAATDVPETEEEIVGVTVTSAGDPDKITVSLDAVELEDVVRLFTRLSGANIICNTTNLNGTVTANLADIGWKPAFKAILRQQGLALIEDPLNPGVYEIGVPPPPGREPLVSKTFKLNYLKASEAATILRNFLGLDAGGKPQGAKRTQTRDKDGRVVEEVEAIANEQKGYVVAHPAANTVIVSCRGEDKMREVEKVITDLDVVRQQVYIEAKIVQISGSASKKIGLDWSMLDGYTITAGPFARQYTKTQNRNRGTTHGDATESDRFNRYWSAGEAEFPSTLPDGSPSPWASLFRTKSVAATEADKTATWTSSSDSSTKLHDSTVSDVRTAIFSAPAMQVALSALETSDDIAQISNPKLIVANEERAIIDMTKKEPYIELSKENNTDNNSTSYSAELKTIPKDGNASSPYIEGAFFTYGINVDVTPRINNPSNITVVIEPMISAANGTKTVVLDSATQTTMDYPIIDVKRVRTTFSLGNGQTAVIGGLTTTGDKEIVKKIPVLGSIPILKYLFSHTEKVKEQYETIIFVTVGIVDPDNSESRMGLPDGARLVQKRIDENGKIIDKRFKDMETKEQKLEADLKEAEAKGLIVPEVVEE